MFRIKKLELLLAKEKIVSKSVKESLGERNESDGTPRIRLVARIDVRSINHTFSVSLFFN